MFHNKIGTVEIKAMNNSKTNSVNSKLIPSIVLFMLFFMLSFSGYSQTQAGSAIEINGNGTATSEKVESSRVTTNLEFAQWFMGTKQDPNSTLSTEGSNAKKTIITSGIAPNRLLIKAFLKKVVNYENAVS